MEKPPQHVAAIRLNGWAVTLASIPVTLVCMAGFFVLGRLLPHHHFSGRWWALWTLLAVLVVFVLHELTHALAAIWRTRLPWSAFRFGVNPKFLTLYCHCCRPLKLADYRAVALGPLMVLGTMSALLLLIYPTDWLALAGGVHLAGCIGDVWIFALLRKYPGDALVVDHPTDPGCDLYQSDPASVTVSGETIQA